MDYILNETHNFYQLFNLTFHRLLSKSNNNMIFSYTKHGPWEESYALKHNKAKPHVCSTKTKRLVRWKESSQTRVRKTRS